MMDHEKIKEGVRLMLEGIGEDIHREGLLDTPDRAHHYLDSFLQQTKWYLRLL